MGKRQNGFTLIEVMVAMSILAIALVAVFQLQSQSVAMSAESRFMTSAALLAQSKMTEAETLTELTTQSKDGDFGNDYPQYRWQMTVTNTDVPRLKKIEVTVSNKVLVKGGTYSLILYKMSGG